MDMSLQCSKLSWKKADFPHMKLKVYKTMYLYGFENEVKHFLEVLSLDKLQNLMIPMHKFVLKLDDRH